MRVPSYAECAASRRRGARRLALTHARRVQQLVRVCEWAHTVAARADPAYRTVKLGVPGAEQFCAKCRWLREGQGEWRPCLQFERERVVRLLGAEGVRPGGFGGREGFLTRRLYYHFSMTPASR